MTRRVVSNVEAYHSQKQNEFDVVSYLLAYRSRSSIPEGGFYVAVRVTRCDAAPQAGSFRAGACIWIRP